MAVHFVGFRGDELHSAVKVFGEPDFFHRLNDHRLWDEVVDGDTVVFANGFENKKARFSFNDSEHF